MIKHIVFFKIESSNLDDKKVKVTKLKELLDNLKSLIPEIKSLEAGINISDRPLAYDLALVTEFENKDDLSIYRYHPEHKKVVEYINEIKESIVVVDYEF